MERPICGANSCSRNILEMQQKILVTGATGFIGNYIIKTLLQQGYNVVATSANIDKAAAADWFNQVTYIAFDFNNFDKGINYFSFFNEPDRLIHLSWEGLPNYKADFHLAKNLPLQKAFLENLLQNGLKDITVTGTCFEYGMKEGCLKEDMECEPANPYAIAKNELRIALEKLSAQYGAGFKWVRLFYMFGKGQSPKSLISQLDKALEEGTTVFNMSGGEQVRDFLPVEKVAAYIVAIALQKTITGVVNCCSGKPITVKAFVENYLSSNNRTIKLNLGYYPYSDYEPMSFWGDNTKLKSIIYL